MRNPHADKAEDPARRRTLERSFLRQVRFSVGCFGGSVLSLGDFVRSRLWPGRKLTLTVPWLWGKDSGGGQVRFVACWGLKHGVIG